jgi:hypothetical protein
MRDVQTQRKTPRRSSEFLKNIDAVLSEVDDSDAAHEARKAKNTAEIEKIFPGVEEDEKTLSGMYEPALHNYGQWQHKTVRERPDVNLISEMESQGITSRELTVDQQRRMFPTSRAHNIVGTGPKIIRDTAIVSDSDRDTPNFGTGREERDYTGFEQSGPSEHPIGSDAYWNQMDFHAKHNRLARLRQQRSHRRTQQEYTRNENEFATNIRGTTRRSRNPEAGPVTNTRSAAELMSQGNPARAGGRSGGMHSFRGRAEPVVNLGRMPGQLSPNLRNLETDYTVFSYSTPIAWRTTQGHWEVPRMDYSRTTQRHQSAIRRALGNSYHSPLAEASYRISDLRQQHLEQGIRLPSRNYQVNIGFETFHPEPPSEDMINKVVQDHLQNVINPAIERHRRGTRVQRQQSQRNQPQLPLEGGIA